MPPPNIRRLDDKERAALLSADVPAYLATVTRSGYPRVTPIWFIWDGEAFIMTSYDNKRHVGDLQHNAKTALCIEVEARSDGRRPNWQVRTSGSVTLTQDTDGHWTRQISEKYLPGQHAQIDARTATGPERYAIRMVPGRLIGLASSDVRFDVKLMTPSSAHRALVTGPPAYGSGEG